MEIRGIPDSVSLDKFNQAMELMGIEEGSHVLEMYVREGTIRLEIDSKAYTLSGNRLTHSVVIPVLTANESVLADEH